MFHILGFLFLILIAILFIGLSIIGTVLRSIFGLGGRRSSGTYRNENGNNQSASSHEETARKETTNPRKKLFSQDEGEYVDFEEIKD